MSPSVCARASQKYKSWLSLERGGYGPHTGTPMSGAKRARRFRERRKAAADENADAARNFLLKYLKYRQSCFYLFQSFTLKAIH